MRLGQGAELRVTLRTGGDFGVGGMDMDMGLDFVFGFGGLLLVPALAFLAGLEVAAEVNGKYATPK